MKFFDVLNLLLNTEPPLKGWRWIIFLDQTECFGGRNSSDCLQRGMTNRGAEQVTSQTAIYGNLQQSW